MTIQDLLSKFSENKSTFEKKEKEFDELVSKKAEDMIMDEHLKLLRNYEYKEEMLTYKFNDFKNNYTFMIGLMLASLLITSTYQIFLKKTVLEDFYQALQTILSLLSGWCNALVSIILKGSSLANMIDQPILYWISKILIIIIVSSILVGVSVIPLYFGVKKLLELFWLYYCDRISLGVFTFEYLTIVYFADYIKLVIPWNTFALLLLLFVLYILGRWFFNTLDSNRRDRILSTGGKWLLYIGIPILCMVSVVLMASKIGLTYASLILCVTVLITAIILSYKSK